MLPFSFNDELLHGLLDLGGMGYVRKKESFVMKRGALDLRCGSLGSFLVCL